MSLQNYQRMVNVKVIDAIILNQTHAIINIIGILDFASGALMVRNAYETAIAELEGGCWATATASGSSQWSQADWFPKSWGTNLMELSVGNAAGSNL